jgi:hypothetical protein
VIRRNTDEELRDLERVVRSDITVLPRLIQMSARTGSYAPAVRSLIEHGWQAGAITITPMPLGSPRDDLVIELGRELIRRGWLPDLPLSPEAYRERRTVREGTTVGDRYGQRTLTRVTPPVRLEGQFTRSRQRALGVPVGRSAAKTWQFRALYGFAGMSGSETNQGLDFFFDIIPQGRSHMAEVFAREMVRDGKADLLRRVAPDAWFLYRWEGAQATTMPQGLGGTGLRAGLRSHYPANQLHFYRQSSPAHRLYQLAPAETPESQYRLFRQTAKPVLPDDALPPPMPTDATREEADKLTAKVRAWLLDPDRLERIHALFYGDLWLGGFLIPPEEVRYDPETMRLR